MSHSPRIALAATAAVALGVGAVACSPSSQDANQASSKTDPSEDGGQEIAKDGHEVVADPVTEPVVGDAGASSDGMVTKGRTPSGLAASKRFFDQADKVVIALVSGDDGPGEAGAPREGVPTIEERAAMMAVQRKAPMLVLGQRPIEEYTKELERLGAKTLVIVGGGEFDLPPEIRDGNWELDTMLKPAGDGEAGEPAGEPGEAGGGGEGDKPADAPGDGAKPAGESGGAGEGDGAAAKPAGAKQELAERVAALGEGEPSIATPVFASADSGVAAIATARAAGAQVHVLPSADPRATKESSELVQERSTIALGAEFGSTDHYRSAAELAGRGEQPGGGELVFPGRRMIALYGHPSGGALGVLGKKSPEQAVAHVNDLVAQYQGVSDEPVIPAFEIIATVAASQPGPNDLYTNVTDPADLVPYVDAITQAGGYAVLDLQPGRANFLDQAKQYEELLKRPNVGLALDPEWHFDDGGKPLDRVGSVEAAQVNEVSEWLAGLVRDNNLPQKALVLHQFQLQMLRDREQIVTDHPELAMVLHADGHGSAQKKFETWNAMRKGLDPRFFMAWKNFTKEDKPMFSPEQTFQDVNPRPWFVSYQ